MTVHSKIETTAVNKQAGPAVSAGAWDLRHPGLLMTGSNGEVVHEFTGMWPLKPDADLVVLTDGLSREPPYWGGPLKTFSEATTMLGLIRTARWFVGTSADFGPTLYFVSQFDSSLEKYFDDFVLNGKTNLETVWGQCIGCPTGPDATARDIVQYVARGQIKTLACYDALPSLNLARSRRWPTGTRRCRSSSARSTPATATSRTRSMLSSASWPSPTNSCGAAPPSTPTPPTSGSSPTSPSGWA